MGLSQSDAPPMHEVQKPHDNVGAQQHGAAENLRHDAQQNSSKDVSNEKAYWSSQSEKGTANHLHGMSIDFGHENPAGANGKAGSHNPSEGQGSGADGGKTAGGKTRGLSLGEMGGSSKNNDQGVVNEHTHTVNQDNSATDVTKNGDSTITKNTDSQGKATGEERSTSYGTRTGWKNNSDGSTTRYNGIDGKEWSEQTSKDDKLVSEKTMKNTPDGQIKTEKKYDEKGNSIETGTGPKAEHNFTKTDDGKGNSLTQQADGKGYSRTQETNGSFVESHYGPDKNDSYTVKGDGKGRNTEIREGEDGTSTAKYTSPDSSENYTSQIKPGANGSYTEQRSYGDNSKDNTITHTPDDKGGYVEKTSYADSSKDNTVTHTPDGNGGYVEKTSYADSHKDYTKEVGADGKTVYTDNVGLKAQSYNASPEFQKKEWDDLRSLPEADRKVLADNGTKYAIGGKMDDINPSAPFTQPRGWDRGRNWDDVDGGFDRSKNQVNVTEETNSGPTQRANGALRHETGHAMDHALGEVSHSEAFQKAYDKDVANLSPTEKNNQGYLLQDHDAGKEETYAEVYGALKGASGNPEQTQAVLNDFPSVSELIKKGLPQGN